MKVIEGGFGKKVDAELEVDITVRTVIERVLEEETIDSFQHALISVFSTDGSAMFSTNMTVPEAYIHLDMLKDYLLHSDDYETEDL